jgi:starvation-inducible outer membrane lipoprotein
MIKKIINFIITVLVIFVFIVVLFGFMRNEYNDLIGMIDYVFQSFKLANIYFWSFINKNVSPNIVYKIHEIKYNIIN